MLYFRTKQSLDVSSILKHPATIGAITGGALGGSGASLGSMLYNSGRNDKDQTNTLRNTLLGTLGGAALGGGAGGLYKKYLSNTAQTSPPTVSNRNYDALLRTLDSSENERKALEKFLDQEGLVSSKDTDISSTKPTVSITERTDKNYNHRVWWNQTEARKVLDLLQALRELQQQE